MIFRKEVSIILVSVLFLLVLLPAESAQQDITLNKFDEMSVQTSKPVVFTDKSQIIPVGNKVMLQTFYWEHYMKVPDSGLWWNTLKDNIPEYAQVGFDGIWAPPLHKTKEGDTARMGYEPYDYYDLGEFDQMGGVRTRYGTREELEAFIAEANAHDIGVLADVVINHRVGGDLEYNPFVSGETPTNFMNVASGKLKMNYSHFWPNAYGESDYYAFANFPDICHEHPYVRSELIEWGNWLRDEIGFDGWRFDVALGIEPTMLRDWMHNLSGFGIAEYWYGGVDDLQAYLNDTENSLNAFDFPLMYNLRDMINLGGTYDMQNLEFVGLLAKNHSQAITFVQNHDTVRDENVDIPRNRQLGYAFILTHPGYPTVYWLDYYDLDIQPHIKTLMKIRNEYARGNHSVLYSSGDVYVAQWDGDPGLIVGLNDDPLNWKEVSVTSKWQDTELTELTGQSDYTTVSEAGEVILKIPPQGYAIWSTGEQLADLQPEPVFEQHTPPQVIPQHTIVIDGEKDDSWGLPFYIDRLSDASFNYRDLNYMYVSHDNDNLYVAFSTGRKPWNGDDIHYGLGLDTVTGGSYQDPLHEKILWANNQKIDHLYYVKLDAVANSWPVAPHMTQFHFDTATESWNQERNVDDSYHAYNPLLGFIEFKIPLSDIDISSTGTYDIKLKLFSTVESQLNAVDSVPQDDYVYPSGSSDEDSWLTLPEDISLTVDIPEESSSVSSSSSQSSSSSETSQPPVSTTSISVLVPPVSLIILFVIRKKRKTTEC